ncbi:hypothetical protein, partial [Geminicoccus harenae]|uniref:hypothetical protein n=1 Tax=Geminicoccus harenae TaxID=2498453 RepID=UPI00168AC730
MAISLRKMRELVGYSRVSPDQPRDATVTPFRGRRVRTPELELEHLSVTLDVSLGVLFARMKHKERACYTQALM